MDLDDFRSILDTAGVDVWAFIDAAIVVASADNGGELKRRRDAIVERLYAATSVPPRCPNCEANDEETKKRGKSSTEEEEEEEEDLEELDPYGGLFDEEQKKILEIKQQLQDPHQSEDSLVELLQNLADMDITFQALRETDIGRHVSWLRKHSSNEVRRLAKLLVRKWKETVDEWMKLKAPGESATVIADDEDSPRQKNQQNGHHQIPDFAYSPNPQIGNLGSERNNSSEAEPKPKTIPRKEAPPKPAPSPLVPTPSPAPQNRQREQRESNFDLERLASARKRLQENYKEAANAKKQRTIQVMDLRELPKPKNAFFAKNKGDIGSRGRHW